MRRKIVFRPQAVREAIEAHDWYESREPGLGDEFTSKTEALIGRIAENPLAFPRVHNDVRRAVLSRLPYAIYFREVEDGVVVLAVHGRQDPTRWQGRR